MTLIGGAAPIVPEIVEFLAAISSARCVHSAPFSGLDSQPARVPSTHAGNTDERLTLTAAAVIGCLNVQQSAKVLGAKSFLWAITAALAPPAITESAIGSIGSVWGVDRGRDGVRMMHFEMRSQSYSSPSVVPSPYAGAMVRSLCIVRPLSNAGLPLARSYFRLQM